MLISNFIQIVFQVYQISLVIKKMLTCSLTFHSPQTIYNFLKTNVGALFLTLKAGKAIINFFRSEDAEIALQKYNNTNISGLPLQLKPFREDQPEIIPVAPQQQLPIEPISKPQLSEFTILIEQSLKINNPNNQFEILTKKNRKEIMEYVNSYNPLLEAAEKKSQQIIAEGDNPQQSKKVEQFSRYYESGLNLITKKLKQQFKILRRNCSKFGGQDSIEVEPNIQISTTKNKPLEANSFKTHLQYLNNQTSNLKRLSAINDKQFICTANNLNKQQGKLLFFKTDDEYPFQMIGIKEGAYGLAVIDSHILVGTNYGHIAFFNSTNLFQSEISIQLHSGLISDINLFGLRQNGYSLATLGMESTIKIWSVKQQQYQQNNSTLFFQQSISITSPNNRRINSVDTLIQNQQIVFSSDKYIYPHDCIENKSLSPLQCVGMTLKVISITDNIVGAASEKYLSFVDIRKPANTRSYHLKKDIRTLAALNDFSVFYGCMDGEVGVIDSRQDSVLWRNTTNHKMQIYDICKIGSQIISCDAGGQVVSWFPNQQVTCL